MKLLGFEDNDLLLRTLAHTGIIVERIEDTTRDKLLNRIMDLVNQREELQIVIPWIDRTLELDLPITI